MERITSRHNDGEVYVESTAFCIQDALDRLAEYEDTGFTPENLRDDGFWGKFIQISNDLKNTGVDLDRVQELMKADEAGRIVIIPEGNYKFTLTKET